MQFTGEIKQAILYFTFVVNVTIIYAVVIGVRSIKQITKCYINYNK